MKLINCLSVLLAAGLCACEKYKLDDNAAQPKIESSKESEDSRIEKIEAVKKKLVELYSHKQLDDAISKIAAEMNQRFKDSNPIVVCVLKGAIPFFGQLLTRLSFNLEIDCVRVSSYSGEERKDLKWALKPSVNCVGRNVILVDDCIDSGLTLGRVVKFYKELGAKEVYAVALFNKTGACRHPEGLQTVDIYGLPIPGDIFLYGFGLDCDGYLRNLPAIYSAKR